MPLFSRKEMYDSKGYYEERQALRRQFESKVGVSLAELQENPAIGYIEWLERQILNVSENIADNNSTENKR
jgi:hypothetical protein